MRKTLENCEVSLYLMVYCSPVHEDKGAEVMCRALNRPRKASVAHFLYKRFLDPSLQIYIYNME